MRVSLRGALGFGLHVTPLVDLGLRFVDVFLGIGLAFLVKAISPFPAAVAPWSVGVAVALGVSVGMAAGIYPANRASKLDPITALRSE